MRFRFIHSCMVLAVVGLLVFYSAFLTSPTYQDDNGDLSSAAESLILTSLGGDVVDGKGDVQTSILQARGSDPIPLDGLLLQQSLQDLENSQQAVNNFNSITSAIGVDDNITKDNLASSSASNSPNFNELMLQSSPHQALSSPFLGISTIESNHEVKRELNSNNNQNQITNDPEYINRNNNPSEDPESLIVSPPGPKITNKNNKESSPIPPKKKVSAPKKPISSSPAKSFQAITTRDIYEFGFSYSNPGLCPNDGQDIHLFIMIMSAPGHFSARDAIRLTWGHFSQRMDISMAFLLGRTENETILEGIEAEKHLYDDLIVANFEDSYDNLTLKTMSTLEWIDTYCNQSAFVLKTDDDMFINVPNLLNFINKIQESDRKQPKIYGRLAKKWKPVRNKKSKYFISFQQYKKTVYPDFTTGPAYLFSTRIVRPLLEKGLETTYLKLEDVYTTGLLAQELGIKRMNIGDFANKKVNFHKTGYCALSRLISMHMVAFHEQFELWKKLLDGRTKCKIIYQNGSNSKSSHKPLANSKSSSNSNNSNSSNVVPGATVKSSSKKRK